MTASGLNVTISIILAVSAIFVFWKKGGNQASAELVAMYKARDELQDKERKEMKDQIQNMTIEIGRLNGINEEKDKRISILESVQIDKNPMMVTFMEYLTRVAKESEEYMRDDGKETHQIMGILTEIKNFMGSINQHMILQHPSPHTV